MKRGLAIVAVFLLAIGLGVAAGSWGVPRVTSLAEAGGSTAR